MKKTKTRQAAPAAKPAATKKFRFRVVGGKHIQDGLIYKPGQIIESDTDLAEKFSNRFKRLNGAQAMNEDFDEEAFANADVLDKPTKLLDKAPAEPAEEDDTDDEITSDLGENVTEDFDAASEAGLLVFKSKAGFYVTTEDDADKALNKKPLKQSAVGDFISDQSDDAEDEDEDEDDEPAPKKTVKVSKKKSK